MPGATVPEARLPGARLPETRLPGARAVAVDAGLGAGAGALARLVMGRVTGFLYAREALPARRAEDAVRGGKVSYEVAAEKAAALFGVRLGKRRRARVGKAFSWALALGAGALYGVVRPRVKAASLGAGLLFGTVFFLVMDEGVNAAFGFTAGPRAFPWQAHARGLAGHLAYGAAADLQLRLAQRALH